MKKYLALLLALLLVLLCACGSNTNTENASIDPPPMDDAEDQAEAAPAGYSHPLTGEFTEDDLSGTRPLALMMNNISLAMPMHGIQDADIIFEMNVEGNITRMCSLFQNITAATEKIGSIRSARPYYIDWVLAFDAVYSSAGGSNTAMSHIGSRGVPYIHAEGSFPAGVTFRDQSRINSGYAWEHTLFMSGKEFEEKKASMPISFNHRDGYTCSLKFTDTAQTDGGADASNVTIYMNPGKTTGFVYDESTGLYKVSQYGGPFIDGNTGNQLETKNVLALYTSYWQERPGAVTLLADMSGGKGVYICEGKMIDINWSRTDAGGLILTKADGSELELAVGNSFVCCPDASSGGVSAN